jgi:hypothetical protein
VAKITSANAVVKVAEEFQKGTLALSAAETAAASKGAKRKRAPPSTGVNDVPLGDRSSSQQQLSSQFVGSLNAGNRSSDDEGDEDDAELYAAMARRDGTQKNRRGQKARQTIAEKKHGQKAKHVIEQQKKEARHLLKLEAAAAAAAGKVAAAAQLAWGSTPWVVDMRK